MVRTEGAQIVTPSKQISRIVWPPEYLDIFIVNIGNCTRKCFDRILFYGVFIQFSTVLHPLHILNKW